MVDVYADARRGPGIKSVEIHLVKIKNNWQNPTVPVLEGDKREEKLHHQPTSRRVGLTSKG